MLIQDESLSRKFITKGAWIYLFTFLGAPLGYLINILLAGDLTKAEFWMIYAVISFLGLVWIFSDFWLTESLNYFLPKYILKNDYARSKYLLWFVFSNQVITSIIVWVGLYFLAPWLAENFFHESETVWVIQIMTLFFFWVHGTQVVTSFFSSIQNTKLQKLIEFSRNFFTLIGISILFLSDQGNLLNYCWMWIGGVYISFFLGAILFYKNYYGTHLHTPLLRDPELRRVFVAYSFWTLVSANVSTILHLVDQLFLTYFLGVEESGTYKIYLSLVWIPFIFLSPIISFLYPVIAEMWSKWNKDKIQTIFQLFSTYTSVIMIWVGWFFLISWRDIAWLLFGETYTDAWVALYFIAPFLMLNVLIQLNFQILGWLWYIKKRIWILFWTLIVNSILTLSFILGFKYNILPFPSGSAAASLWVGLSWICMWWLSYHAIREYGRWFDWWFFLKNLVIVVCITWLMIVWKEKFDFSLGWEGRKQFIPLIVLAILSCLTIFLSVNISRIREFFITIKKVRSWTL